MQIVDKRRLRDLVPYSPQHIARLEKDGKFPQRVQLGPCRVGWLLQDVENWIAQKVSQRPPLREE